MKNSFFEYEEITNRKLKEVVNSNEALHQYFSSEFGKIKAKNYCGILNIEGEDFYILPKIAKNFSTDLNIFTYMLMNVFNMKVKNEDLSGSENKKHQLLEVFIDLFAKMLFRELQKGVYKTYVTEEDNLRTLRGKYLPLQDLTKNFTREKIYCEYDEFSENNELNQFFLYAVNTLSNYTKRKKLLKTIESALIDVEKKHFDIKNLNFFFNRLNERFEKSFNVAILLLNHFIPLFEKNRESFAFLFDMNELFEKFVGNIYKEIDPSTKLQKIRNFGNLKLIPDIHIEKRIIDCKYKKISSKEDLSRDDKYQMFVYGKNFDVKNTMLLYPKHISDLKEDLNLGRDDEKVVLNLRNLDLSVESLGYEDYIENIKEKVRTLESSL